METQNNDTEIDDKGKDQHQELSLIYLVARIKFVTCTIHGNALFIFVCLIVSEKQWLLTIHYLAF